MRRYAVVILGGRGHALDSGERVEERLATSPDHAIELCQLAAGEVALDVQPLDPDPAPPEPGLAVEPERWYSVGDLAVMTGRGRASVYRWLQRGLPATDATGERLVRGSDLARWLGRRRR